MPHRMVLTFDAVAEGIETSAVVNRVLEVVPPPRPVWRQGGHAQPSGQSQPRAAAGQPEFR
jgi:MoxR-like ATPase